MALHTVQARIMLKVARGYAFVPLAQILYFKAADKYAELHFADGSHCMVFHSMRQLEEMLGCTQLPHSRYFIRVHRQYIASMAHAAALSERCQLRFESGAEVPVSRAGLGLLKGGMMGVGGL